jgi:hypothetical protein
MPTNVDAIARFFEQKMQIHDLIQSCIQLPSDHGYYLYMIERKKLLPSLTIHISATYRYGFADFASRPTEIKSGSFIVVSHFGPDVSPDLIEHARTVHIGLGHVRKLMGALNSREVWKYRSPGEKEAAKSSRWSLFDR